jgi:hypothetical protein
MRRSRRRLVAAAIWLVAMCAAGAGASLASAANDTSGPPPPPGVRRDGTVDASQIPKTLKLEDSSGRLVGTVSASDFFNATFDGAVEGGVENVPGHG